VGDGQPVSGPEPGGKVGTGQRIALGTPARSRGGGLRRRRSGSARPGLLRRGGEGKRGSEEKREALQRPTPLGKKNGDVGVDRSSPQKGRKKGEGNGKGESRKSLSMQARQVHTSGQMRRTTKTVKCRQLPGDTNLKQEGHGAGGQPGEFFLKRGCEGSKTGKKDHGLPATRGAKTTG